MPVIGLACFWTAFPNLSRLSFASELLSFSISHPPYFHFYSVADWLAGPLAPFSLSPFSLPRFLPLFILSSCQSSLSFLLPYYYCHSAPPSSMWVSRTKLLMLDLAFDVYNAVILLAQKSIIFFCTILHFSYQLHF